MRHDAAPGISRRTFLRGAAAGTATLLLDLHCLGFPPASAAMPGAERQYRHWEDLYRERWTWDRVAVGTHAYANCAGSCAWNLYIRDGVIWREEQSAPYSASNSTLPDWNPRGCQKGASCSSLMLGPARLRYPLRRVGKRGSGRWKRIGWDEALDEIAGSLVDTLARRGGEGVLCEMGSNHDLGPGWASLMRFFRQIGGMVTDINGQLGDGNMGATLTFGIPLPGGSSDDWFRSRYIVIWQYNPVVTRIPEAHFLSEARYHGARIVTIAPDYSPSAIHADLWLSPRPGTDAALALAACRVILEEHLYNADYVREQTDLPFLVRTDTRHFLREADLVAGGRDDRFACWDEAAKEIFWAPGTAGSPERTLRFAPDRRPALEAEVPVRLASGEEIRVRTVFSILRERLEAFSLEAAARSTGIGTGMIRRFAREFASAPAALILGGASATKNYHGDLMQRTQILLAALTGNIGRAGGGFRIMAFFHLTGPTLVAFMDGLGEQDLANLAARSKTEPQAVAEDFTSAYISGTLFHAVHGGLREMQTNPAYGDPGLPRSPNAYLTEALEQGHLRVGPPPGADPPEVLISAYGNVLRHIRMGDRVRDSLFARAKLVVDIGVRMSETARSADILLPAAAMYEKMGIKYAVAYVPYLTLGDRAVPPLAESKPEWEIFSLLAERVAAEARRRKVTEVRSHRGQPCDLSRFSERFSDRGRFGARDEEAVTRFMLATSRAAQGITLEELRARGGAVRLRDVGEESSWTGIYSEYRQDEPVVPMRHFVEEKRPYPTLTGRQQFYIDAPLFLEVGEELPIHKEPPAAGGNYPFTLTGGHTRWSIHSIWRDQDLMLRLQRGEPVVFLNEAVARDRGIADHEYVRVWNDVGAFVARAKLTGSMHPRQVHIYHAWEPYQFRGGSSDQHLCPSPIKVTELTGGYGHLHRGVAYWDVNQVDRDTRVEVSKA